MEVEILMDDADIVVNMDNSSLSVNDGSLYSKGEIDSMLANKVNGTLTMSITDGIVSVSD